RPGADSSTVGVSPTSASCVATYSAAARSPRDVARSPVLEVSKRIRSRQMSTTSSAAVRSGAVMISSYQWLGVASQWLGGRERRSGRPPRSVVAVGHLAGPDRGVDPVFLRGERAGPAIVVGTRGVVEVVGVEGDPAVGLDHQTPAERA